MVIYGTEIKTMVIPDPIPVNNLLPDSNETIDDSTPIDTTDIPE